eukprot:sb/3471732/
MSAPKSGISSRVPSSVVPLGVTPLELSSCWWSVTESNRGAGWSGIRTKVSPSSAFRRRGGYDESRPLSFGIDILVRDRLSIEIEGRVLASPVSPLSDMMDMSSERHNPSDSFEPFDILKSKTFKLLLLLLLRVPGLAYGKPTRDCRKAISPALEQGRLLYPPNRPWTVCKSCQRRGCI